MTSNASRNASALVRFGPALAFLAGGFALAFAYAYRAEAAEGAPALHLRPYLGGDDPTASSPSYLLRGGIVGLVFGLSYLLLDRAIERSGFRRHPPAAAFALAALFAAPAFAGVFRNDFSDLFETNFGLSVDMFLGGAEGRIRAGLRTFAEAPALAYSVDPRLELPTGVPPNDAARLAAGLAFHALFVAAAAMLSGVKKTAIGVVGGVGTAVLTAVLLPAYVPGSPWHALPILAWYVTPLAFSLATAGASGVRSTAAGLAVGAVLVAISFGSDRAPRLARRGAALLGPDAATARARDFVDETDPARLVLFVVDVAGYDRGRGDAPALAPHVYEGAVRRARALLDSGAPAIDSIRLEAILADLAKGFLASTPAVAPGSADPEYEALLEATTRRAEELERLVAGRFSDTYRLAVAAALESPAIPDAAEMRVRSPNDPRGRAAVERLRNLFALLVEPAAKSGDFANAVALREAYRDLADPEIQKTYAIEIRAALGYHRVFAGEFKEGAQDLAATVESAKVDPVLRALYYGALGIALLAEGDRVGAAAALKKCWDFYGGKWSDETSGLRFDQTDYWLLAEIAAARRDVAADGSDPDLHAQAARDAERFLETPLKIPAPPYPALLFAAEARLRSGLRDEAKVLLRRAREVPHADFNDRVDGATGRLSWPRYRRRALEALRELLDSPEDAAERAAVESELAAIER